MQHEKKYVQAKPSFLSPSAQINVFWCMKSNDTKLVSLHPMCLINWITENEMHAMKSILIILLLSFDKILLISGIFLFYGSQEGNIYIT